MYRIFWATCCLKCLSISISLKSYLQLYNAIFFGGRALEFDRLTHLLNLHLIQVWKMFSSLWLCFDLALLEISYFRAIHHAHFTWHLRNVYRCCILSVQINCKFNRILAAPHIRLDTSKNVWAGDLYTALVSGLFIWKAL